MLRARNLHVTIDGTTILHGVDFIAEPGEVTAIVGPNGSGKSTLLSALTGTQTFDGEAQMGALDLATAKPWELAARRAVLAQFTSVAFPFFKDVLLNIGWFYVAFAAFTIVGFSNAVNLTDGLDGLAIVPVMMASAAFGMIAYLAGNFVFSEYLQIHHVPGAGELSVFLAAIIGGGTGFLWYNAPPAKIFMGDTGSLALGGALGAVAVTTKHELVLGIVGGLFVLEALSVMIQVGYYKATKKRVFLMAPIHHHFEKMGWPESTVVIRFWILAGLCVAGGLGIFYAEWVAGT